MRFLGIDTSNYTTSAAIYDTEKGLIHQRLLLPVKKGERGIRQSDAVFHHTQQLPVVIERLAAESPIDPSAIGVSKTPRQTNGSYMPCFTAGVSLAHSLSAVLKVPFYTFSHQEGHIAAALYSVGKLDMINSPFIAFHISGGTTEALYVNGMSAGRMNIEIISKTLDLNAGQLIDRVGVMLGMNFPCGRELETAALQYAGDKSEFQFRPAVKGLDCCLSGVENKCLKMIEIGETREKTAAYCLFCVEKTILSVCEKIKSIYGNIPFLFAGGVMSNVLIRSSIENTFPSVFSHREFSSDNAAGIAVMTEMMWRNNNVRS